MLLELHVKNLALIEKADLEFKNGLTIITGETGAGKSILIDSINICLGARFSKDMIRTGADNAYIELVFKIEDEKISKFRELEIEIAEDNLLIISRKISLQKSVVRVNDETITLSKLKTITSLLIDIHGQHEHQSLMNISKHLQILDLYGAKKIEVYKEEISKLFREYKPIVEYLSNEIDVNMRNREIEILNFEINEIESANIQKDEEEYIRGEFKKLKNGAKIKKALTKALDILDNTDISMAGKEVSEVSSLDENLTEIEKQLLDIDELVSDTKKSLIDYVEDFEFDEEKFDELEKRLEEIHRIQAKYGVEVEEIERVFIEKKERLEFLENYDIQRQEALEKKKKLELELVRISDLLTNERKIVGESLKKDIVNQLKDLNFLGVEFDIRFDKLKNFTQTGRDSIEFLISTNPGEPIKPLREVVSGGELSRIMLAIKTVLSKLDEVDTMIFDEVDTGISGRTAEKVAKKLMLISRLQQVFCITHLPQIAVMADNHFIISKDTDGHSTKTIIKDIEGEDIVNELARLLGGSEITPALLNTAREMKVSANLKKSKYKEE